MIKLQKGELKMLQSIIGLTKKACSKCGVEFADGAVAYSSESRRICCLDCTATPSVRPHYLIERNSAYLQLNVLSFRLIADGIYEIKERDDRYYIISRYEEDKFDPDDIFKTFCENTYLLEKKEENAVLILPESKRIYKKDFSFYNERYKSLFNWFKLVTKCKDPNMLFRADDLMRGISNLTYSELRSKKGEESFISCLYLRSSMTVESVNEEIRKAHPRIFTRHALKKFSPRDLLDYCENRIQGQGSQLKLAVYLIYKYVEAVSSGDTFTAQNWLLTAPSGSGKTEFFRAIRDFFKENKIPIPVVQIDLSLITEEGYRGMDTTAIPKRILEESPECGGNGICFLDEADKKCLPSFCSHGTDTNAAVQSNLLTLIEGSKMKIDDKEFNSERTMFILLGAFQAVRHEKYNKANESKSRLGFFTDFDDNKSDFSDGLYGDITIQDIIDYGMQEELAGRLSQVVNFHKLPEDVLLEVIRNKAKSIGQELEINIHLTKNAEKELAAEASGSMGIRRPMNIIRELAQRAVVEAFFDSETGENEYNVVISSLTEYYLADKKPARKRKER